MIDLSTKYMGFTLKNPLIVGSSGLTNSVDGLVKAEKYGAAAVVLKSLFEEQIIHHINKLHQHNDVVYAYPEAEDYLNTYAKDQDIDIHLRLIEMAKKSIGIPVIASVNCASSPEWITYAQQMQNAGADALELNMFILPSNPKKTGEANEAVYFDIILQLIKQVKIPVSLKISYYFSGLANFVLKLSWTGISGMVLFNRFYSPDIDIEKMQVVAGHVFSTPDEIALPLRWVAMLSDRIQCDIAASTGIHDGRAVIKQLLAGAKAVQLASVLYKQGFEVMPEMIHTLEDWMTRHNYSKITDFQGKLSFKEAEDPAAYERVQFMKHFAGIE